MPKAALASDSHRAKALSKSFLLLTMRVPRPPPPATALMMTLPFIDLKNS